MLGRTCRRDDEIEALGVDSGDVEGSLAGVGRHRRRGLVAPGDSPLTDPGATPDPGVIGVD